MVIEGTSKSLVQVRIIRGQRRCTSNNMWKGWGRRPDVYKGLSVVVASAEGQGPHTVKLQALIDCSDGERREFSEELRRTITLMRKEAWERELANLPSPPPPPPPPPIKCWWEIIVGGCCWDSRIPDQLQYTKGKAPTEQGRNMQSALEQEQGVGIHTIEAEQRRVD